MTANYVVHFLGYINSVKFIYLLFIIFLNAGLVENLVNSGRLIDAVHFAHAFQLTERYPPVPLLKKHLEETIERSVAVSGQVSIWHLLFVVTVLYYSQQSSN